MKSSIIFALFLIVSIWLQAQTPEWFATISPAYPLNGISGAIKKNMERNNFNLTDPFDITLFGAGSTKYPQASPGGTGLLMVGKRVASKGSLYIVGGLTGNAKVSGYNSRDLVRIKYTVMQVGAGYQFGFPGTGVTIGAGPSLFVFKYKEQVGGNVQETIAKPGGLMTVRAPIGRNLNFFGVEFFAQLNVAPSVEIKEVQTSTNKLPATTASMVALMLGLSFAFHQNSR